MMPATHTKPRVWTRLRRTVKKTPGRTGLDRQMPRSMFARARLLLLPLFAAVFLAACSAADRPSLGPPAFGLSEARALGTAPVRGAENVRFAFITLTGIPGQARFDLEKALKKYAATRNLNIVVGDDPTATYRIKGYLSAVGDENGTLLVYTWDVYDTGGRPLHRIAGQQTAKGAAGDPWAGIEITQLDDAARETIDKLADWIRP